MPVTSYSHPRSLPHPNATGEIGNAWPEDGLLKVIRGGGDRSDLMGGSRTGLHSSEEGKEHNSVWYSSESDIDAGRFKRRATTLNLVITLKVL